MIGRRGTTAWTLTVTGKPAHSSQIFRAGHRLRRDLRGGAHPQRVPREAGGRAAPDVQSRRSILGGTNVELDVAQARGIGLRQGQRHPRTRHRLRRSARALERAVRAGAKDDGGDRGPSSLPQTKATIAFDEGYPPLAPTDGNRKLLALYDQASRDVGAGPVTAVDPDRPAPPTSRSSPARCR